MKAFIGCDHTGEDVKKALIFVLNSFNITSEEVQMKEDYTDVAYAISQKTLESPSAIGIIICGSGVGVSIVANRFKGIRACLAHSPLVAELSRKHNNANILCLGARIAPIEVQIEILKAFLTANFEGGRHEVRINKIDS
jgi:ribose 5-phosphate isomerase B